MDFVIVPTSSPSIEFHFVWNIENCQHHCLSFHEHMEVLEGDIFTPFNGIKEKRREENSVPLSLFVICWRSVNLPQQSDKNTEKCEFKS